MDRPDPPKHAPDGDFRHQEDVPARQIDGFVGRVFVGDGAGSAPVRAVNVAHRKIEHGQGIDERVPERIEEPTGVGQFDIIRKHAFPNAIAPIINVVMLNLAFLVVGVVVVEVIFVYPGMGQYLVDHVAKRDVPVVQAVGLIFAAVYIGLNIVADVAGILTNPRLRHPK